MNSKETGEEQTAEQGIHFLGKVGDTTRVKPISWREREKIALPWMK
jgi:hypothetical protein